MENSKYAPGPIRVSVESGAAGGITGKCNVTLRVNGYAHTVESVRALCEAAPDLLAALEVVTAELAMPGCHKQSKIRDARAAIAKAKGES